MKTIRIAFAVAASAAALTVASPSPAGAESAVARLQHLCTSNGGDVFSTPYALVRCQEARSNKGFEAERAICEDEIGGTFGAAPSFGWRHNRTTWQCSRPAIG